MNNNNNNSDHLFNLEIHDRESSSSLPNQTSRVNVDSFFENNNTNNRYNNRRRYRQHNYVGRNNYLHTYTSHDRIRNVDRDIHYYLEMYRDIQRESQQERNMLHQIHNNLLRQNNLLQSMRVDINNIWNHIRSNEEYMRSRYHRSNNNPIANPIDNQRINVNGIPYIVENIQRFNFQPTTNSISRDFINSFMNLTDFQSNVPIIPTRQHILNATREILFGDIETPINTTCPISLETFQETDVVTQILHCGHNFNTRPLNTWFQSNVRCPMCRYDIREYNNDINGPSNNNLEVPLETIQEPHPTTPTTPTTSTTPTTPTTSTPPTTSLPYISIDYSERRTRNTPRRVFSDTPNLATNLSSITMNTINELFERNENIFTENDSSRFLFDPSNNILLLFESLINNGNNFPYRNTSNRRSSNNGNPDSRNIV